MEKKKKIILTGGGTAGHCVPNLALVPELKEKGFEISYIGSYTGIERKLVTTEGIDYHAISSGKLRRYFDWKNFSDPFRVVKGFIQAVRYLRKERPDIVFSKGGFVSVPVVKAAAFLKIPVIIHESDMTPGLANRMSYSSASKICCSFRETLKYLPEEKAVFTGSPVRASLRAGERGRGRAFTGFSGSDKPTILVTGGSLGRGITAGGGNLSLQGISVDTVTNLGNVILNSNMGLAIDADLANETANKIDALNVNTDGKKIEINSINILSDALNEIPVVISVVADKNNIDLLDSLTLGSSVIINRGSGVKGNYLTTYANGDLSFSYQDLVSAIITDTKEKVYTMSVSEGITEELQMGGESLSINGDDGISIAGNGTNGIKIADENQSLSLNKVTVSGFDTAIDNSKGGDITVTDVTFSSNTTDIVNKGNLTFHGTDVVKNITDNDDKQTGIINIGDANNTATVTFAEDGSVVQKEINIATGSELTNGGTIDVASFDNGGTATNNGSISGTITNSGSLTNNNEIIGNITNSATLINNKTIIGDISNDGTLNNSDSITGKLINTSSVTNTGRLNVKDNSSNSGTITGSGSITTSGNVTNSGTISQTTVGIASGKLTNTGSVTTDTLTNGGEFANNNTLVAGNITNNGTITGSGSTTVSGTFTNGGSLAQGSLTIQDGASLTSTADITLINKIDAAI